MIEFIKRKKLNLEKYDACIEKSMQSNIFGYSWYLDTVCDNWSVFVLNDYEAVLPIPWKRKFFVKYAYLPFWVLQLGVYTKVIEDENEFLIELFSEFKYVNTRMNFNNSFSMFEKYSRQATIQKIVFSNNDYDRVYKLYSRSRKKEIKKSNQNNLTSHWNESPKLLIDLMRENKKGNLKITEKEYMKLFELMYKTVQKGIGEILLIRDKGAHVISGAFFLRNRDEVIKIVYSTRMNNKKNGVDTFLNDCAILKYSKEVKEFNFGISSIDNESITKYYRSFGGQDKSFIRLKNRKLPWLFRFFNA